MGACTQLQVQALAGWSQSSKPLPKPTSTQDMATCSHIHSMCASSSWEAPLLLCWCFLVMQMAEGFKKVRKYFDMLDLNGDR